MTSTMEKLFAMVEDISNTLKEIKSNQEELKASNEEIKKELKEIKERLDKLEEPVEEEVEESNEETMSSQDQLNAFFNCMMNTMQAQAESTAQQTENTTYGNEYTPYVNMNNSSDDSDIEAIADRLRNNAAAQAKLNSENFSSLDNFDFEGTFGGKKSFNQNNERPPEPVYHRVEPQIQQMNLDGFFNNNQNTPSGNNWYGNNNPEPDKTYHIGMSPDKSTMIFRRNKNGQTISFMIARDSIMWNTIINKLMKENRRLSSLDNRELSELALYANDMMFKGVDMFSPINQNIINQFNNANGNTTQPQQNPVDNILDAVDSAPVGMGYPSQGVSSPQYNQYNPTPMMQTPLQQDFSRRNMTTQNFYACGNNSSYQSTNNMWANYGQDIINNSAPINQQPQQNQNVNFTTGGYTNPFNVKPVFNNSFGIFGR